MVEIDESIKTGHRKTTLTTGIIRLDITFERKTRKNQFRDDTLLTKPGSQMLFFYFLSSRIWWFVLVSSVIKAPDTYLVKVLVSLSLVF